jgi:hypothetical protein
VARAARAAAAGARCPACCGASAGSGGRTWADEASGVNNAHWQAPGNRLIGLGLAGALPRIGREFNGNWHPWQVAEGGQASYIAGYRHVVTVLRGLPGAAFQFCWSPTLGVGNLTTRGTESRYSGDSYVDEIGRHFASWVRTYRRPPPGSPPADLPGLSAAGQAAAWLEAERPNLHAAVDYAAASGRSLYAVRIPAAISGFLAARGLRDQSNALHQIALAAARKSGDRPGQATALGELGVLAWMTGDYPAAAARLADTAALYADIGDLPDQAYALTYLGFVQRLTGDCRAAIANYQQALTLARQADDRPAEAEALSNLGEVQHLTGDYLAATENQQLALKLYTETGNRYGQALALNEIGMIQQETGDWFWPTFRGPGLRSCQQEQLESGAAIRFAS